MHYYTDVVFKKYAVFKGRASRSEYWYFVLFNIIISIILLVICKLIGDQKNILRTVYGLAVMLPGIGLAMRRMHDINKSGWWILINLIPLLGLIWFIVFACRDSQPGDNKYGPNPKEVASPQVPPQQAV